MSHYGEQKVDWWRSYKDVSGGFIYDWGALHRLDAATHAL